MACLHLDLKAALFLVKVNLAGNSNFSGSGRMVPRIIVLVDDHLELSQECSVRWCKVKKEQLG